MPLVEDLHRWSGFFTLLGECTASFAGLLFVAIALNSQRFQDPENRHLMLLARQTFFNLLMLTSLSLFAMLPVATIESYSQGALAASVAGLITCLAAMREERRARSGQRASVETLRAYYGPALIYMFFGWAGVRVMLGRPDHIAFFGMGAIMLLLVSARNAWLLLVLKGHYWK